MKYIVSYEEYGVLLQSLLEELRVIDFDCIVCLKRSGFIVGVFLSNKLTRPLFTASEINSIPIHLKRVLIVDDKVCTGKSIRKVIRQLKDLNKSVETACLIIERTYLTNYFVKYKGKIIKMWYEV